MLARARCAKATTKQGRRADVAPSPVSTSAAPCSNSARSPTYILVLGASPSTSSNGVDAEHVLRRRSAGDLWRQRLPGPSSSPIAGGLGAAERSSYVATSRRRQQP